jgi:hypothetical protein
MQKNVSPTAPLAPSPYEVAQVREVSVDLPHPVDVVKKQTPLKKPVPAARKSKELVNLIKFKLVTLLSFAPINDTTHNIMQQALYRP